MSTQTPRRLGLTVASAALVVAACGSTATTPAPTAGVGQPAGSSPAPTIALPSLALPTIALPTIAVPTIAVPTIALPSIVIPSFAIPSFALPSGSFAIPSFAFPSADKDLESRLPSQLNGVALTRYSFKGATFLGSGSANAQDLIDLLASLGKTPADLSVAFASDTTGALDVQMGAFRVAGADPNGLLAGFIAAARKSTPEDVITQVNAGGKNVTQIVDPADTASGTVYIYVSGDVLFYVLTPDTTLAGAALQVLP